MFYFASCNRGCDRYWITCRHFPIDEESCYQVTVSEIAQAHNWIQFWKRDERGIVSVLAMTAYGEVQVHSCTYSGTQYEISGAVNFTTRQFNTEESKFFPIEWEVGRSTASVCTLWRWQSPSPVGNWTTFPDFQPLSPSLCRVSYPGYCPKYYIIFKTAASTNFLQLSNSNFYNYTQFVWELFHCLEINTIYFGKLNL
jgi:hypothetical protein